MLKLQKWHPIIKDVSRYYVQKIKHSSITWIHATPPSSMQANEYATFIEASKWISGKSTYQQSSSESSETVKSPSNTRENMQKVYTKKICVMCSLDRLWDKGDKQECTSYSVSVKQIKHKSYWIPLNRTWIMFSWR